MVIVTFGTSASTTAYKNLPPRLMIPFFSCSTPGKNPGVSTTNTSGMSNASLNRMNRAALSDASLSIAPTCAWAGWPPHQRSARPPARSR